MPRPVPGAPYVIVPGDTLSGIAAAAFGNGRRWREIWEANKTTLRSGDPNLIFPLEVIYIPPVPPEVDAAVDPALIALPTKPLKGKDDFTLVLGSREVNVSEATFLQTMDTCCDAWTAKVPFDYLRMFSVIKPFGYTDSDVYIGPKLGTRSVLYDIELGLGGDGRTAELWGFTATADIVDSCGQPPYEAVNVSLLDRCKKLLIPFGIPVKIDASNPDVAITAATPFEKVTMAPTDKIFNHLQSLAAQRNILISCTELGELFLTAANVNGTSVGTLEEGGPYFESAKLKFSGRKRWGVYSVYNQLNDKAARRKKTPVYYDAIALDPKVSTRRVLRDSYDQASSFSMQASADWKRARAFGEGLNFPLTVNGWYAPNGFRWRPNTIVTVKSPTLAIPLGFDFLIKSAEFHFATNRTCTLQLIAPSAYSGDMPVGPISWL